jgi:ribosome maturation factor RimP
MIEKKRIEEIIESHLDHEKHFVAEISVSTSNRIMVFIDGVNGVSIDDCVSVSRAIEHQLDRDTEDFELEVSSAGLDQPLKVPRQFTKNLERNVVVTLSDGSKITGKLTEAGEKGFTIETRIPETVEGKKKKQLVIKQVGFQYDEVRSVKLEISFK